MTPVRAYLIQATVMPQTGWCVNNDGLLAVLGAGSLRSGRQHGWLTALSRVTQGDTVLAPWKGGRLPGPFVGLCPPGLCTSRRPRRLTPSRQAVGF